MKLHEYTMSVRPGTGLVARFPSAVVLVSGAADEAVADRLIELFNGPAPALDHDLETVFGRLEPAGVEAFAAVVETDKGLSVYLHGPVEVAADGPNVEFRAWGPGPTPLLSYDTPDAVDSLSVYLTGEEFDGHGTALDLLAGVVSGNGLVLKRAGAEPRSLPLKESPPVSGAMEPPHLTFPAQSPSTMDTAVRGRLRPTYLTRLLTRLLVTLTLGVAVTFALGQVLRAGIAAVSYPTAFISLALLLGAGLVVWDPVYGLLQRIRAARDWPAALLLVAAMPEALLAYGAQTVVLGEPVVNRTALIVQLAGTAALLALATFGLAFVPFTRRRLFRAGRPTTSTVDSVPTVPAGPSSPPAPNGHSGMAPLVWGINCAEGHFNRPDARYCGTCGTAMHGLTLEPVQGPRPALGYLVSDDGSAYVVDSDYVIGRSPRSDGKVRTGTARALTINGTAQAIAEAHADVHIDQWDVTISDRGHTSGTYVREPDSTSLIRLAPGQPFALRSGTHIHIGQCNFVFHALNRR